MRPERPAFPGLALVVCQHGSEVSRHPLPVGEHNIGRASAASISIQVGPVSRQHARLVVEESGAVWIEDLISANGTLLDEQPIGGLTVWSPGQTIRIGEITLELQAAVAAVSVSSDAAVSAAAEPDADAFARRHLPLVARQAQHLAVESEIARGGMGAVMQVRESATRRTVAMKVMLRDGDAKSTLRFIEEAQVTAQLEHPNIVPVHDLGLDEHGQPFYTMKLVAGITLGKVIQLLREGVPATVQKYPLPALLTAFQKICDALAFAHSRGVIHRDLKPANIMLGKFGEVLVMDWGLAKIVESRGSTGEGGPALALGSRPSAFDSIQSARRGEEDFHTMEGAVMCTPSYMSPEQARGETDTLETVSDVFTLGVILYEILTLERPFAGKTAAEVIEKIIAGDFVPPAQRVLGSARAPLAVSGTPPETSAAATAAGRGTRHGTRGACAPHLPGGRVPASLDAIVRKAMSLHRADRYPGVPALQADLLAYQTGFATSAESRSAWKQVKLLIKRNRGVSTAVAAAVVLLLGVSGAFTVKVIGERNRANRALADLRKAAPTLAAEARELIDEQQFDDALIKIRFACEIDRDHAGYRLLLAQLLQARLELAPAVEEFRRVLALGPNDSALANLALCERLLREYPPPAPLDNVALLALHEQMEKERRFTQAAPVAMKLGKSKQAVDAVLQAKLIEWRKILGWAEDERNRWGWLPDGTLSITFKRTRLDDLTSLRGIPITKLDISETRVADLSPLVGLRLREIQMQYLDIRDLTPLKEMPLEVLDLASLKKCPDLGPLAGMKLKKLSLRADDRDLSVLNGMPLSEVHLKGTFTNIAFLAGAPITSLSLVACGKLTDISAVRTMPLKRAGFGDCDALRDFAPLLDCPTLERVFLTSGLKEIGVLRNHPSLRSIGYEHDFKKTKPAAEFWADYDAQQAAGKK